MHRELPTSAILLTLTIGVLAVQALALYLFGQPAICECGTIKLWEPVVQSAGNSQHISDWYTFSHIIHGFLFYGLLHLLFPRMPILARLLIAVCMEAAWEIAENTPYVINAYREQALAQGYTGDSILNSISDTLAMILGFLLAMRLRVFVIVGLILAMELAVGYIIHDNLTLNILNFIYPIDAISSWQAGL